MAVENKNPETVRPNKGLLFFNPGDRFSEPIAYSIPGQGDIHAIAKWPIDAPENSTFRVPTELKLLNDNIRLPIDFATTVLNRFKDRGVIMIDDEWEPGGDEEEDDKQPFARNEEEAKEKGKRIWRHYLQTVVKNHIDQVNRARAMGGFPLEATGFTKRAFKLLNMVDPATQQFEMLQQQANAPASNNAEIEALKAQVAELTKLITKQQNLEEAKARLEADDKAETQTAKKRS